MTTVVQRGSFVTWVVCVATWGLLLLADFAFEFRSEYHCSLLLLLCIVMDKLKDRCLAFSVCIVCVISVVAAVVYYQLVPPPHPFLVASCGLWMHYVWCAERGISLSTITQWLLFVIVEALLSMHDVTSLSRKIYVCRPFAAHCIGYALVILNFGPTGSERPPVPIGPGALQDETMTASETREQTEYGRTDSAPIESHKSRSAKAKKGSTRKKNEGSGSKTFDGSGGSSATAERAMACSTQIAPLSTQLTHEDVRHKYPDITRVEASRKNERDQESNIKEYRIKQEQLKKDIQHCQKLEVEVKHLKSNLEASRKNERDQESIIKEDRIKQEQLKKDIQHCQQEKEILQKNLESVSRSRDQLKANYETTRRQLESAQRTNNALNLRLNAAEKTTAPHKKAVEATASNKTASSKPRTNAWNAGGNYYLVGQQETGDEVQSDGLPQKNRSSLAIAAATHEGNGDFTSQPHHQNSIIEGDISKKTYAMLEEDNEQLRQCITTYQTHLEKLKKLRGVDQSTIKSQEENIERLERQLKLQQIQLASLSQRLFLTMVAEFLVNMFCITGLVGEDEKKWNEPTKCTIGPILTLRKKPEGAKTWMRKPPILVKLNEVFTDEQWEIMAELNSRANKALHSSTLLQGIDGEHLVYVLNNFRLSVPPYDAVSEQTARARDVIRSIVKKVDPCEYCDFFVNVLEL